MLERKCDVSFTLKPVVSIVSRSIISTIEGVCQTYQSLLFNDLDYFCDDPLYYNCNFLGEQEIIVYGVMLLWNIVHICL